MITWEAKLPEISIDKACSILAEASTGCMCINDEFKEACRLAVKIMRRFEREAKNKVEF